MKIFMRIFGYSALTLLLLIGYTIWATETDIYRCEGKGRFALSFIDKYEPELGKIENPYTKIVGFLKIESHTRIVLLWSDSRHDIWWEKPNESTSFWSNVTEVGDQLQIRNYQGDIEGVYSKISNSFSFVTNTEFEGICEKTAS